jgi:hypothetical protein
MIDRPPRQADLVMPLAMEYDLRTVGRTRPNPVYELRVLLEGPLAMPVGYHQQCRHESPLRTELPKPGDTCGLSGAHVVDRDQEHQAPRIRR